MSRSPERLDIRSARALALAAGTGFPARFPPSADGVARAVAAVGFVQIDTISVVRRAHEHILWSRVPAPGFSAIPELEGVGGPPRRVVEYWAHAAAYLPIEEWRFCIPRMERIRAAGHEWFRADPAAVAYVRDKIASEGPCSSRDFREPMRGGRGWWDWKPTKIALEYLFHAGELVSVTRKNFQKLYDLSERQIPAEQAGPVPTERELSARHVERAAAALGVFAKEDAVYQRKDGLAGVDAALEGALESGVLVRMDAEGFGNRPAYVLGSLLETSASGAVPREPRGRAFILSPFDPFVINRKRCARLWNFEFSIECYLPEAKRAFGYFALPILYIPEDSGSARFAGIVDAKTDRKTRTLILRRLRLSCRGSVSPAKGSQSDVGPVEPEDLAAAVAAEIARFAVFQGTERVELERLETDDLRLKSAFRKELKHAVRRG